MSLSIPATHPASPDCSTASPGTAAAIRTRAELSAWLAADRAAHGLGRPLTLRERAALTSRAQVLAFQENLRALEWALGQPPSGSRRLALMALWRRHAHLSAKFAFTIPPRTFGPGLCIAHIGTVVVSERARVGAGCRIHPSTSIGADHDGAPVIGQRAYIAPGARIIGAITLGDDVVVGANAVVRDSFPERGSVLVGAPARMIKTTAWEWRH